MSWVGILNSKNGKKRGVGISKHQKCEKEGWKFRNAKKSETKEGWDYFFFGPLIAGSMVHGSYFNTSKGRVLRWVGMLNRKNGIKRGMGILRFKKMVKTRGRVIETPKKIDKKRGENVEISKNW